MIKDIFEQPKLAKVTPAMLAKMPEGRRKLQTGDFNNCSRYRLDDGSYVVTIDKYGDNKLYRFQVKNLYLEDEEIIEYEEKEL